MAGPDGSDQQSLIARAHDFAPGVRHTGRPRLRRQPFIPGPGLLQLHRLGPGIQSLDHRPDLPNLTLIEPCPRAHKKNAQRIISRSVVLAHITEDFKAFTAAEQGFVFKFGLVFSLEIQRPDNLIHCAPVFARRLQRYKIAQHHQLMGSAQHIGAVTGYGLPLNLNLIADMTSSRVQRLPETRLGHPAQLLQISLHGLEVFNGALQLLENLQAIRPIPHRFEQRGIHHLRLVPEHLRVHLLQ